MRIFAVASTLALLVVVSDHCRHVQAFVPYTGYYPDGHSFHEGKVSHPITRSGKVSGSKITISTALSGSDGSQQLQQQEPDESKFVKWLRDEIKNVTFTSRRNAVIIAKHLLKMKAEGKNRDYLILAGESICIGKIKIPPDEDEDEIIKNAAEQICDYLLDSATTTIISKERTFVSIAFQVAGSKESLSHDVDYRSFMEYLRTVFNAYYPDQETRTNGEGYVAPYFPFVQSSGMGKTKLLYHVVLNHPMRGNGEKNQAVLAEESGSFSAPQWEAKLILCRSRSPDNTDNEDKVFNEFFDYHRMSATMQNMTYDDAYNIVKEELNSYITTLDGNAQRNIVLLFDEASNLLSPNVALTEDKVGTTKSYGVEALLFRLVRLWLAEKRDDGVRLVAVFAGTSSSLRNYRSLDTLPMSKGAEVSREFRPKRDFYPRGDALFGEFCALTTLGCLRDEQLVVAEQQEESALALSEYGKAIPYGRPLFAKMQSQGQLLPDKLPTILGRMLAIENEIWKGSLESMSNKHDCWMSILGTRVQMGQTSMTMASSLVGRSYANLVGVSEDTARICFGPDPVCARVAMCLMDEDCTMEIPSSTGALVPVKGFSKAWWVKKACELFSRGLAIPDKGNFAEVMMALYLLFCADEERKLLNPKGGQAVHHEWYQSFSVRIDRWVDRLVHGGEPSIDWDEDADQCPFYFNTIQICRNHLRGYEHSWKELGDQDFLKHLYQSGVGFYTFSGCETIDMVFPLKCSSGEGQADTYCPMVISIKSRAKFYPGEVTKELAKMSKKAKAAKWKTGLCLLVLLGPKASAKTRADQLSSSVVEDMQNVKGSRVPCKVLYMPSDDKFGLSKAFDEVIAVEEMSEILASHSFATFYRGSSSRDKSFARKWMRARPKTQNPDQGLELMEALTTLGSEPTNSKNNEALPKKRRGSKSTDQTRKVPSRRGTKRADQGERK